MTLTDVQRDPCGCSECVVAGVSKLPQRRDPWTGEWLHGKAARRWYEAKARFDELRNSIKPKVMG